MNPSKPSWPPSLPEWPEYFSPERPKPIDDQATRMVMKMWATALLVAAVVVLVYLLARLI